MILSSRHLTLLLLLAFSPIVYADDAYSSWSSTTNSTASTWQYGTETTLGGPLTLFTQHASNSAPAYNWWSWNGFFVGPVIALNTSGNTITFSASYPIVWPSSPELLIAPGGVENASPAYTVLRWHAQESGAFDVTGALSDLQNASVTYYLLDNGVQKLNGSFPGGSGLQGTQSFSATDISVNAGDDLDFIVYSRGDEGYDTLGVSETVTPSVPEPSSALVLAVVGLGLTLLRRCSCRRAMFEFGSPM